MKDYLKMSDFIVGHVSISLVNNCDVLVQYDYADPDMHVRKTMDAMEHAINSYDELVEMNKELLAALESAVECGMVPTSSASEGGAMKYVRQAHVADQIRAAISKANGEQQSQPNALRDDVYVAGGKA